MLLINRVAQLSFPVFGSIGIGMLFFSLEALDRVLGNDGFVVNLTRDNSELVHNLILLCGLVSSGIGFSKLTKIAK